MRILRGSRIGRAAVVATAAVMLVGLAPADAQTATGFVGRNGRQLTLNGAPYRFTGLNAYHISSDYRVNYGCGEASSAAQVDQFLGSLRRNSTVRFWAFQQLAWDKNTKSLSFTTIDRIVAAAERRGQKLVVTLGNQWGPSCGEVRKTESWYAGGYRQLVTPSDAISLEAVRLPYRDYVSRIVSRYANSPAIAIWEPINEPAADDGQNNCSSTAPATLRRFFDDVGGLIHSLDSRHLVSSGLTGSGQCGSRSGEYQTLHQSPGIDVASYHDYGRDDAPMPGDQWNGLQVRLNQAAAVNKPLYIGEVGIKARDGVAGCMTTAQRRDKLAAKMSAQFAAGIAGYLPWVAVKANVGASCGADRGYDIVQGQDPTMALLRDWAL